MKKAGKKGLKRGSLSDTKGKKPTKNFDKRIVILVIAALFIVILAVQKNISKEKTTSETPTTEAPKEPEQAPRCTEMWLCQNQNTKAYRKADCSFEQITNCEAGCENGECKKAVEEIKTAEPQTEKQEEEAAKEEPKQTCTIGFKCLDEKRKGYQSSNCEFTQVVQCEGSCKDGKCIPPPPEEEVEETFSSTEGKAEIGWLGRRYCDFSEEQILLDEVDSFDLKLRLYPKSTAYEYLRTEAQGSDLWLIEKGIIDATREDCIENMKDKTSYYQYLTSGKTLCIWTRERNIALAGGYWEGVPDEYTEISWRYYVPK